LVIAAGMISQFAKWPEMNTAPFPAVADAVQDIEADDFHPARRVRIDLRQVRQLARCAPGRLPGGEGRFSTCSSVQSGNAIFRFRRIVLCCDRRGPIWRSSQPPKFDARSGPIALTGAQ
jgi:hypothetical protein